MSAAIRLEDLRRMCEHGHWEAHWRSHDRPYHDDNVCALFMVTASEVASVLSDADLLGELVRRRLAGVGWYCWVAGGYADVEECRSVHPRRGCRPAYEMAVGLEVPMELWQPEWLPPGRSE